jgi:hypothetical protein
MRLLLFCTSLLAFGLACAGAPEEEEEDDDPFDFGDADTDADSDADADADTDADTDTDTDTDTDASDRDGDGYPSGEDCDDGAAQVYPGAPERCNDVDDDCDGEIDDGVGTTFYADSDGDGFGDESRTRTACEPPAGYVSNANDCDDDEASVYPGGDDVCDGLDNDCDGDSDPDCGYSRLVGNLLLIDGSTTCDWDSEGTPDTTGDCPSCDFAFEVTGDEVNGDCYTPIDTVMGWDAGARNWNVYWNGDLLGSLDGVITYGSRYDTVTAEGTAMGGYMLYGDFRLY